MNATLHDICQTSKQEFDLTSASDQSYLYEKTARLNNYSLVFENVAQYISSKTGERLKVPFEIGADTLFKRSYPIPVPNLKIGTDLKRARRKAGLSQEALAQKSGTSRTYISRIENNHSDIELATLCKIIEIGLGKTLEIKIK